MFPLRFQTRVQIRYYCTRSRLDGAWLIADAAIAGHPEAAQESMLRGGSPDEHAHVANKFMAEWFTARPTTEEAMDRVPGSHPCLCGNLLCVRQETRHPQLLLALLPCSALEEGP